MNPLQKLNFTTGRYKESFQSTQDAKASQLQNMLQIFHVTFCLQGWRLKSISEIQSYNWIAQCVQTFCTFQHNFSCNLLTGSFKELLQSTQDVNATQLLNVWQNFSCNILPARLKTWILFRNSFLQLVALKSHCTRCEGSAVQY